MDNRQTHWENVYENKGDLEVSWYQEVPETSLTIIEALNLNKEAAIIDIGGGNSNLTAELIKNNYTDLSVLDISAKALERTKAKLGADASKADWIASDILQFDKNKKYDLWHDRAAFHFLTEESDIQKYMETVMNHLAPKAYLILATFSLSGPKKCSGLDISQYNAETLQRLFGDHFDLLDSFEKPHQTPFGTEQQFVYAVFRKK